MTKNDFILQAMLQMAGNEKYVTIDKGEDGTLFPTLQEECIFIDDNPANIAMAESLGITGYLFDGDAAKLRTYLEEKQII